MLQGVIFDIDGTLVDSNDAHAKSWVDTFAEGGYNVPFDAVRPLIGLGADKLLPKDDPADLLAEFESSRIGRESR